MSLPESGFEELMARLRRGDELAAEEIFQRYARRLIALAEWRLGRLFQAREDPEDAVQSAFRSFFRRQFQGQYQLDSPESLWGLLAAFTLRKCGHRFEYHFAARRDIRREAAPEPHTKGLSDIESLARDPTPMEALALVETVEDLLARTSEHDRPFVELCLQGEPVDRIAAIQGCSERTVARVLERVRKRLEQGNEE
jgi:RNA polymerase sigma-70 factor (ECF subfamily)